MQRAQDHAGRVSIRTMRPSDLPAILRVAGRDGLPLPGGELLVAEVDGELRAALSKETGEALADPFHPGDHLLELLHLRAEQLRAERPRANGTAVPESLRGRHPGRLPALRRFRRA